MITTLLLTAALAFPLEDNLRALAAIAGEPNRIGAAGITREEMPILTIENGAAFDPAATRRRLVLIGLDGDAGSADAVVAAVRWFKTRASSVTRRQWTISALPSAHFDPADTLSLTRWITFQAPDLVVTIGGGGDPLKGVPSKSMTWDTLQSVPYKSIRVGDGLQAVPNAMAEFQKI